MKFIITLCCLFTALIVYTQNTVEPFLEAAVSEFPNVRDIAISPNQDEAVFSAQSFMGEVSALITVKKQNGTWSKSKVISFSGQYFDIEPFFSSDGLTLYFASNRPMDNTSSETKDFDIWYVKRETLKSEWSKPINMGAPINTSKDEFYPAITNSGNLYFTLDDKELKQRDNIYVSKYVDGKYTTPRSLGEGVNSEGYEFNAYVAPDESFMIYSCYNRKDGLGSGDLYISYNKDGKWSEAKNMGEQVNTSKMEYCPYVDTNTNTLYFTSKRLGNYATTDKKKTVDDLKTLFSSYDNGLSRLYKVDLKTYLTKKKY